MARKHYPVVSLVEQELLTLPEHLSSPSVFSGVRITQYLALYVCFVDRCLSFCTFHLVIVLSVLLRYTDSDYLFGIVKLFLRLIVDHKYNMLIYTTMYFHLLSKYSMQVVIFSCPVWCNTGTNSSRCLNTAEIIRFNINNLWLLGFLCQLSRLLASGEFRGVISWATDDARP